ncbi:hypothetical protein Tco_0367429 [Tanacetum coccineum]
MDWYTNNLLWIYWKRGDDEEVFTYDELSDLEEENVSEENEIVEIFRIEMDTFDFETPLCKEFKEFNHLPLIDVDWYEGLEDGDLKDESLKEKLSLKDHGDMRTGKEIIFALERFNNHEPMEDDDDDIRDLDDYLIPQDACYYVDEEEETFKERKSKLLGIHYVKPPTFKYKKFEVIKYSLGPAVEYVAIKDMIMIFGYEPNKAFLTSTKKYLARRTKGGP